MQAYEAARYSSNIDGLVVAKMDLKRFKAINTAKGRWSLLDRMQLVPKKRQIASSLSEGVELETKHEQVSLEAVQEAVREVAENLLGESLSGLFSNKCLQCVVVTSYHTLVTVPSLLPYGMIKALSSNKHFRMLQMLS